MATQQQWTVHERTTCRASGGPLRELFDLGDLYLSQFLQPGQRPKLQPVPLRLMINDDSRLVQLSHTVNPELMYREYWYQSGTQEQMRDHLSSVVTQVLNTVRFEQGDAVIDIGCNDGTLLASYEPSWIRRFGFDPSKVKPKFEGTFVNDFFRADLYDGPLAKAVTAIAMFYDLEDPVAFCRDVAKVLDPEGVFVLEQHYLGSMLENNEIDVVCHEHLEYYDITSIEDILYEAGFDVFDVQMNNSNGGSFQVWASKADGSGHRVSPRYMEYKRHEINQNRRWPNFIENVERNKDELLVLLESLKRQGKRVYGYGASTKGNTLLQYCGITPELLPKIAERNPAKHGLVTVGTEIPIISEEQMREEQPDCLLVLPYHFLRSFRRREQEWEQAGGRWIMPIPEPRIIS